MQSLTPSQQKIYNFVLRHWFFYGFPATLRDLCTEFGHSSPNAPASHLRALIKKGFVRKIKHRGSGLAKTVYAPTKPLLIAECGRDNRVLVGSVGGAVNFDPREWIAWLRNELTKAKAI
jgi:hypothetical protein